jgi:AcrR family transcriptional regulator
MSEANHTRRPQQRALETRTALLDKAIDGFSAKGFDGISVRQLEEAAGVKRGLVAYHFGDKDGLWRAAVAQLFTALGEDFTGRVEALVDIAPEEAARAMIRAFVRYSAAHPELNRLMMQESLSDSWRVATLVDEHIRPMLDSLAEVMPEAAALIWGNGEPHRYYTFIGASAFVFSAEQECRRLFGVSPREDSFVERHADMVVTLLLGDR